jgi:hypothetical protein
MSGRRGPLLWASPVQALLVGLVALALSLAYFGVPLLQYHAAHILGSGGDPLAFTWFLDWWPYALRHGLDPFRTSYLWAPSGVNLLWSTSIPLPSLLASPLSQAFGAIASYNILALLSPALATFAAFLLLREFARPIPAALGSYAFGFSTYEIAQLTSHLNLMLVFWVPLLAWVWLRAYRGTLSRRTIVLASAGLFIGLLGTSLEVFATTVFFGSLTALQLWLASDEARPRIVGASLSVAAGLLLACLVTSPWLLALIAHAPPTAPNSPVEFSTDPLNWLIPTQLNLFGGHAFAGLSARFTGNYAEQDAYLGLPLVIVMIATVVRYWRSAAVRTTAIIIVLVMVLSLGPVLHLGDVSYGVLPWAALERLPLIGDALPSRFMLYASLGGAALLAKWLDGARGSWPNWLLGSAALLALVPNVMDQGGYWLQPVRVPSLFRATEVRKYFPPNENILVLPYAEAAAADVDQWASGMYFRMPEGYALGPTPATFAEMPLLDELAAGEGLGTPGLGQRLKAFVQAAGVQAVVEVGGQADSLDDAGLFSRVVRVGSAEVGYIRPTLARRASSLGHLAKAAVATEFGDLLHAARAFLHQGHPLVDLYPLGLEMRGLLPQAYGGFPEAAANAQWTVTGAYLGALRGQVAIAVDGTWSAVAPLARRYFCVARQIYYPYPYRLAKLAGKPLAASQPGLLVVVMSRRDVESGAACSTRVSR